MRSPTLRCLAAASAIGLALPAAAADLLPPPPVLAEPAGPAVEIGSGWYLRGDVGYVTHGAPVDSLYGATRDPALLMIEEKIDDTFSIGLGVGYRINPWLRVDATVDHRFDSVFTGRNSGSNFVFGHTAARADFTATTGLVNAYLDLGTWGGITPYVGAGVGVSRTSFGNYVSKPVYYSGLAVPSYTYKDKETTQLAWALMAGAAIELGHGALLDIGYRYVHLGEVATRLDEYGFGTKLKDVDAHEFRLGLRYELNRATPSFAAAPVHRPLMARH